MPAVKFLAASTVAAALCCLLACNLETSDKINSNSVLQANAAEIPATPNRNDLNRKFREKRSLTFVYSDGDYAERYRQMLETVNLQTRGGTIAKRMVVASEMSGEELGNEIVVLMGTPSNNETLRKTLPKLPVDFLTDHFVFGGEKFAGESDVFKLFTYPNPLNEELPVYCLAGNTEDAVLDLASKLFGGNGSRLFWRSWGYEIYQDNQMQVFGHFDQKDWKPDPNIHHDFRQVGDTLVTTPHYKFILEGSSVSAARIQKIADRCEATLQALAEFLGGGAEAFSINYHIYDNIEQKGLKYSNNQPAHADPERNDVYVVINEHFQGHQIHLENDLLVRKMLGKPRFAALERGLSMYFTPNWQQHGYAYWARRLYDSGNLPKLNQLLDNEYFEQTSDLVNHSAGGSLTAFLLDRWGKEKLLSVYGNWSPTSGELQQLELQWHRYIEQQPTVAKHWKPSSSTGFFKGFNFAHEGYQIYNGFGSKLAAESIKRLNELNVNAIAIVPYSYMRNPNKAVRIPIMENAGTENDPSVIYAHYAAQEQGMATMLKPQIWLGGGSWPGDVEMHSEEDWKSFFDYYHDWILHYALMAEMHHFDVLCLGVEFARATIQRPDDWRLLAQKIRKLYSGKLTYAANWGEEFEQFDFWDEFDYIGLDCYYPLSDKRTPSRSELTANFKEVLQKAGKISKTYKKPVLFTEIGFRSVDGTWVNPHEDAQNRAFNEEAQNMCYDVVLEAVQDQDWLQGIFWWKWPSYLDHTGRNNRGFTPNRKMTEQTVSRWFDKMR